MVQIFPSRDPDQNLAFYLFVQLKDDRGRFVDCPREDLSLVSSKGSKVLFRIERLQIGRYYLFIDNEEPIKSNQIDLLVQGKPLKELLKLHIQLPHKSHTILKKVRNTHHQLTLELRLADKDNRPVMGPEDPEILIEGYGIIHNLLPISEGVWQFTVDYPEENQIMYFSIRSMGILFKDLYRFQHIEK
jgi:hypothetical protein